VPPRVQYGTSCLLIRNAISSMSCSVEWGFATFFELYFVNHMVQEGPFVEMVMRLPLPTLRP
jgi:hypothetical protein